MEDLRNIIKKSLELIQKKWLYDQQQVNFWTDLDVEIEQLYEIASKELNDDDKLILEIERTRNNIIQN